VVQQRALRKSGRARGVLDLRRISGSDCRKRDRRTAECAEGIPFREADHFAKCGKLGAQRRERFRHRVAAVLWHEKDPGRARLTQHVRELLALIGGVDGHEDHAGKRRAVLEQHPFGQVRRPRGDALAAVEARDQRPCYLLRVPQQLRERPAAQITRRAGDQCDPIGRVLGRLAQQLSHGDVPDRNRTVCRPVSLAERCSHRISSSSERSPRRASIVALRL
jgi:hypothetical protein